MKPMLAWRARYLSHMRSASGIDRKNESLPWPMLVKIIDHEAVLCITSVHFADVRMVFAKIRMIVRQHIGIAARPEKIGRSHASMRDEGKNNERDHLITDRP